MPTILGRGIGPIAYGLMGLALPAQMTSSGQTIPEEEVFACLKQSLACGANLWNAGEFYGTPEHNSLTVLKKYFEKYPEDVDKVVLSVKGCMTDMKPKADAAAVRASVENCIGMLGDKKKIDIFEPARIDKNVPVEETFSELVKLRDEGKIGGISISEAGPQSLRKAAAVTKLEFLEIEVSMFTDDVWTEGTADVAAELGIPILAYSPLGKGWLTGAYQKPEDVKGYTAHHPRFQGEAFRRNLELVDVVKKAAEKQGVTPAQYSIAWVRSRSERPSQPLFIPLPGASSRKRAAENLDSKTIPLESFAEVDEFLKTFVTAGARYRADQMAHLSG